MFVPFSDGRPNGTAQDVVTGFLTSDEKARGRPVGLAIDKSGDLLIADDVGNTVWRVQPPAPRHDARAFQTSRPEGQRDGPGSQQNGRTN